MNSNILLSILENYEPSIKHFSFLTNYISNITTIVLLNLLFQFADSVNNLILFQ